MERMLKPILADTANAHELRADGTYIKVGPQDQDSQESLDCQSWFIDHPLFDVDEEDDLNNTMRAIPSSS
jgi:hypothetical protein